jgi:hypothetical protein
MVDAMGDMVLQHLALDAAEGGADGGDLRDDIDAVAVIPDHAGETAHLPLDTGEALERGRFGFGLH